MQTHGQFSQSGVAHIALPRSACTRANVHGGRKDLVVLIRRLPSLYVQVEVEIRLDGSHDQPLVVRLVVGRG